ncbi:transcriptional regulator GcvA [Oceanibacterium hippocampi]|uniref:Glycine cleavage system transcriptional activator n=1 Tax=Oceanibacterium hippocampi TaxID=745714 RepID=A0A1Y5R6F0_9PROT|nr:transcriptional regulator GcvA [Oceanibacterium hippocampi]SLN10271.1 Glycine cleavage system transcriptional activator [Oceanibacterium hippocampi]
MTRRLPPLNSLRAFEAAARHLSFKKAADELAVTPAAISQQVKLLESFVGVPLFRRLTRSLLLTEAGRAALPSLREAMDRFAEAVDLMRLPHDSEILTVSVMPSFGASWLVPRLERFRLAWPQYDVRIDANDALVDFVRERVDLGLRYGRGKYPGLISHRLMAETVFPVCSPKLLNGPNALKAPADLARHTLLHVQWRGGDQATATTWRSWITAAGLKGIDVDRGPRFTIEGFAMQAALGGQGVALLSGAVAESMLAEGRLVRPFRAEAYEATEFAYYIVYPPAHAERPKVVAFRDWLFEETTRETPII